MSEEEESIIKRWEFMYDSFELNIKNKLDRLRRRLKSNPKLYVDSNRVWLNKFAVGDGLDMCCGDFLTGSARGVDYGFFFGTIHGIISDVRKIPVKDNKYDFIVSNYLDCVENPLVALTEWARILKPNGVLALVVPDSDSSFYLTRKFGPLTNNRKASAFNKNTIKYYLGRSGFSDIEIILSDEMLRVKAKKPLEI